MQNKFIFYVNRLNKKKPIFIVIHCCKNLFARNILLLF